MHKMQSVSWLFQTVLTRNKTEVQLEIFKAMPIGGPLS